ncbi:MAG: TIGR01777 family oxidoreductase [Candidatus Sumerlaeia bacterium]|nr:TIGR01777 family oxidoreductase [Candidatus Sumerlaeia bacterium]
MKIIIPGGSGQIGQVLARHFTAQHHEVLILGRSKPAQLVGRFVSWDGKTPGPWASELEGADVLINLAGRSVNCRYNAKNSAEMMISRIDSTRVLNQVVATLGTPPKVWLQASTATIYRHALDRPMDEATGEIGGNEPGAPRKWNFSVEIAKEWEREFFSTEIPGVRKVALRSAMTMTPDRGGVFDVILGLTRLGLGGTNGNGRQYVSWVHEVDFIRIIDQLIREEKWTGAINICAPNPLPNREFMAAIRRAWGVPIGLPAFAWMMEIGAIFLQTETELVLKSRRVVPGRLLESGFQFQYPTWPEAAKELCERVKKQRGIR